MKARLQDYYNDRAREYEDIYHRPDPLRRKELAEIAAQIRPHLLILYHQLFHGVTEEELLKEVQVGYDGQVVSGKDLAVN